MLRWPVRFYLILPLPYQDQTWWLFLSLQFSRNTILFMDWIMLLFITLASIILHHISAVKQKSSFSNVMVGGWEGKKKTGERPCFQPWSTPINTSRKAATPYWTNWTYCCPINISLEELGQQVRTPFAIQKPTNRFAELFFLSWLAWFNWICRRLQTRSPTFSRPLSRSSVAEDLTPHPTTSSSQEQKHHFLPIAPRQSYIETKIKARPIFNILARYSTGYKNSNKKGGADTIGKQQDWCHPEYLIGRQSKYCQPFQTLLIIHSSSLQKTRTSKQGLPILF